MNKYLNFKKYLKYFKRKTRIISLIFVNRIRYIFLKYNSWDGKKIQKRALKYCNSLRGSKPWLYRYSKNCPETLWASAFAVLLLNLIGELSKISKKDKDGWIEYIQKFQDKKTGFFIDPKFIENDKRSAIHTSKHLFAHSSTFIMGALILLGGKPLYPIKWVHELKDSSKIKLWAENLPWDVSPWLAGNWIYDLGCSMGMDYFITKDKKNIKVMNTFFEWLDENQLENGWWSTKDGFSPYEEQHGGYHALMVYRMFERPIPRAKKMIESSIFLQLSDNMFAEKGGGGSCEDMDVVDTLASLGMAMEYKREEIKDVFLRSLPSILSKQNFNGGFYDNLKRNRSEFKWKLCFARAGESDICSTLFYCFSIALIGEFLNDNKILNTKWHHHKIYCHCEKNKAKIK